MSHSRRGQMFTADMLASWIVLFLIINLALITWNVSYENRTRLIEERTMRDQVIRSTDLLVRTGGYPEGWDASNVRVAGFAPIDHRLNNTLLAEFHELAYGEQRTAIRSQGNGYRLRVTVNDELVTVPVVVDGEGLGAEPVAYIVEQQETMSNVELLHALNGSDLVWDLYWPSPNDAGALDSLNARHIYTYTDQGPVMFEDMVANLSGDTYGTVIAEDANVGLADISNEDDLKAFVERGGVYFHTEDKITFMKNLFGFTEGSMDGSGNASVVRVHPLLNSSLSPGDYVEFANEDTAFIDHDTMFLNDTSYNPPPEQCVGCRWNVSDGEVYWLNDVTTETGGRTISFENGTQAFQGNLTLTFGRSPMDADTVTVNRRSVLVNTTESDGLTQATLELVFWR